MIGFLIRLTVVVLIGYIIWRMLRPRYTLKIVIGKQGIKYHTGLSKSNKTNILEFFEKHRSFDGDVTICAIRQNNGYLQVVFKGQVDPGTRQQIRNFLITVM